MFSISFIFQPGVYDEEFRRLDAEIQAIADTTEGYLGAETWISADGLRRNAVYYWSDLERLKDFSRSARHLQAKRDYARWYDGYQVVVARITTVYGDGRLEHITAATSPADPAL